MPKKILLTGGSGFIGYNVADQLLGLSYNVKPITRRSEVQILPHATKTTKSLGDITLSLFFVLV